MATTESILPWTFYWLILLALVLVQDYIPRDTRALMALVALGGAWIAVVEQWRQRKNARAERCLIDTLDTATER